MASVQQSLANHCKRKPDVTKYNSEAILIQNFVLLSSVPLVSLLHFMSLLGSSDWLIEPLHTYRFQITGESGHN